MNQMEALAEAYLAALTRGDYDGLMRLFAPKAEVLSPLYGRRQAAEFYRELLADTTRSELRLRDVLANASAQTAAIYFDYDWLLANGGRVSFQVIDWLQLDADGRITELHILYDTVQARAALRTE